MKKLSVIVPTYNQEDSILISLNSILKQNLKNSDYEIIVINDGSTDNTHNKIKKFIDNFKDNIAIKYVKRENKGLTFSKNQGISVSSAENIITIDSDQELTKGVLKECLKLSEKYDMVAIPEIGVGKNLVSKFVEYERKINFTDTGRDIPRFYKKSIFKKIGLFDQNLWFGEDWDVYQRALKKGYKKGLIANNYIKHHEISNILPLIKKYFKYGITSIRLFKKHGKNVNEMYSNINKTFFRNLICFFFKNPFMWFGAMIIKIIRYLSAFSGNIYGKIKR